VSVTARVAAPAKVNLRLRVLGRRVDGYHEIDTLFQAIDLADEVSVRLGEPGIRLQVSGADVGPVTENLAYRAAERFAADFGLVDGVDITLVKHVPAGAGLGGGSSDAAAVLSCLAFLLGVGAHDARLTESAAVLGSDVPFFLGESPLARGRGRGERLDPLRPLPSADLVIVSPPVHVATAGAYAALAAARRGGTLEPAGETPMPRGWADVAACAANDFQSIIVGRHPEVGRALGALTSAGATFAMMSGSGSSVFGMFASRDAAARAAGLLTQQLGWPCRAARTLERLPAPAVG